MKIYSLDYFEKNTSFFLHHAQKQKIFVYPTDTIYGIGCCISKETVRKICKIKLRKSDKHFSILAPSFEWIKAHFFLGEDVEKRYDEDHKQFFGVTYLLKRRNLKFLSYISKNEYIGIRIIQHPFQNFVDKLGEPFITTSANISGEKNPIGLADLSPQIVHHVDVIINGGILNGVASVLITPETGEVMHR